MRTALVLACVVCAACKGKSNDPPPSPVPSGSATADAAIVVDWIPECETALRAAKKVTPVRRVQIVIDGCQPYGDWKPLLLWNVMPADGGPKRDDIERMMLATNGFCDANGKQRFLNNLDDARGKPGRLPWRMLADICKAAVSAVPDSRFASAPYFALDRIGRAASSSQRLAPLLAELELPLPPVSVSGSGYDLAQSPATAPDAGPAQITITPDEIRAGALPRAHLGKDGVAVVMVGEPYPGVAVKKPADIAPVIAKLELDGSVAVFAPSGMSAARVADVIGAARLRDVRIAVAAAGAPAGWTLAGTIPIALVGRFEHDKPPALQSTISLADNPDAAVADVKAKGTNLGEVTISVGRGATVAGLAKVLGALAYYDVKAAAVTSTKP